VVGVDVGTGVEVGVGVEVDVWVGVIVGVSVEGDKKWVAAEQAVIIIKENIKTKTIKMDPGLCIKYLNYQILLSPRRLTHLWLLNLKCISDTLLNLNRVTKLKTLNLGTNVDFHRGFNIINGVECTFDGVFLWSWIRRSVNKKRLTFTFQGC
jgi:hypothetical protein